MDLAGDGDGPSVQFRNVAHERQSQPGAGNVGVLHTRNSIELFENPREVRFRNAVTLVGDRNGDAFLVCAPR